MPLRSKAKKLDNQDLTSESEFQETKIDLDFVHGGLRTSDDITHESDKPDKIRVCLELDRDVHDGIKMLLKNSKSIKGLKPNMRSYINHTLRLSLKKTKAL